MPRERFFTNDGLAGGILRIGLDGKKSAFCVRTRVRGRSFGPDSRLYAVNRGDNEILAYDVDGKAAVIAKGIRGEDLAVAHNGDLYVTEPADNGASESKVWLIKPRIGGSASWMSDCVMPAA